MAAGAQDLWARKVPVHRPYPLPDPRADMSIISSQAQDQLLDLGRKRLRHAPCVPVRNRHR
jgi:hypothetical protein